MNAETINENSPRSSKSRAISQDNHKSADSRRNSQASMEEAKSLRSRSSGKIDIEPKKKKKKEKSLSRSNRTESITTSLKKSKYQQDETLMIAHLSPEDYILYRGELHKISKVENPDDFSAFEIRAQGVKSKKKVRINSKTYHLASLVHYTQLTVATFSDRLFQFEYPLNVNSTLMDFKEEFAYKHSLSKKAIALVLNSQRQNNKELTKNKIGRLIAKDLKLAVVVGKTPYKQYSMIGMSVKGFSRKGNQYGAQTFKYRNFLFVNLDILVRSIYLPNCINTNCSVTIYEFELWELQASPAEYRKKPKKDKPDEDVLADQYDMEELFNDFDGKVVKPGKGWRLFSKAEISCLRSPDSAEESSVGLFYKLDLEKDVLFSRERVYFIRYSLKNNGQGHCYLKVNEPRQSYILDFDEDDVAFNSGPFVNVITQKESSSVLRNCLFGFEFKVYSQFI